MFVFFVLYFTERGATLTTVATVGAGDELLRLLVTILLLGPQTEAADGDGLCHRLMEGQRRVEIVSHF